MRILVAALLLVFGAGLVNAQETAKSTKAPDKFRVKFETSCGDFAVEVQRDWAPLGADRFHELVQAGFYDECRFFRVVPGFVVQWGMNGDPAVYAKWKDREIKDDKVTQSNREGMITFASRGPNTRTCHLFINLADNDRLDELGFSPFVKVL
ncbi:MAG: peptidylprolyl isomerase [Planctomyces sp.]